MDIKMIPATEGYIFSKSNMLNFETIKNSNLLLVFSTTPEAALGGADMRTYLKHKPTIRNVIGLDITKTMRLLVNQSTYNLGPMEDVSLLKYLVNGYKATPSPTLGYLVDEIMRLAETYSKIHKCIIAIVSDDSRIYSLEKTRQYPAIITDGSFLKAFISNIGKSNTVSLKQYDANVKEFIRLVHTPDKRIIINDPSKLKLYHVSPAPTITEMIPRVTVKPLKDENAAIPRISTSPNIIGAIVGTGMAAPDKLSKLDKNQILLYVYEMNIVKDTIVAKPTTKLVPDVDVTDEFWILSKVKVRKVGYITCILNKDKAYTTDYDLSNMKDSEIVDDIKRHLEEDYTESQKKGYGIGGIING